MRKGMRKMMFGYKIKAVRKGMRKMMFKYTLLPKLLARQARPGATHDGSRTKAETYPHQQQISIN